MKARTDGSIAVARVGEIAPGGVKVVRFDDREIAVFRIGDAYHAIEDICTHDGGPLAEGLLEDHIIECPRHGARFDVRTGAALCLPAVAPAPTFPTRIEGDQVLVQVSAAAAPSAAVAAASPAGASPVAPAAPAGTPVAEAAGSAGETVPTGAPSQQEMAIRSALETVMDPEINLSVIDLGLIRQVDVQPGRTHVRMMLTTPFCPYAPQMIEDVKGACLSVVPQETEVEIIPDAWSPELMPDPGLLGYSF